MSTLTVQTISNGTVSTSSANVIQGSARAWVNFNGSGGSIYASYNVSSITVISTGDYAVNFTNAMIDSNYSTLMASRDSGPGNGSGANSSIHANSYLTTSVRVNQYGFAGGYVDNSMVCVAVFR